MSGSQIAPRPEESRQPAGPTPVTPASASRSATGAGGAGVGREPRRAVALTYDPNNADAPVVTAAGEGLVAEEIIRRAREAGVPVTEDPRLAAVLSQIDVGQVIPPELYAVVAEVLAYVYRLEERVARRRP
jgi:flagellar biosynthesis protein